jgi:anaerobic selenocysteine-containing dehydrogenase
MDRILKPRLSRRNFLHVSAAAGSGAILGLSFNGPAAAATAKVAKDTVNYQGSPKGQARCSACSYFQAPSSCNFVNGQISPTGWCVLFKAK